MRRFIKNHPLLSPILSLLTPLFTLLTAAAYYVIGVLEFHYLYLTRGGIIAMLTMVCFAVLNLLFIGLDLCSSYYAVCHLKKEKTTKHILCAVFSILGLIGCLFLWITTFSN